MGALWSQNNQTEVELRHVPHAPALKRRRLNESTSSPVANCPTSASAAPCGIPDALPGTTRGTVLDDTPDGGTHRYIVRCKAIFWCTRKDIVKQIGKLNDMPPYGGLHKVSKWDHFFITFPNKLCAERGVRCLGAHQFRGQQWEVAETAEHSAKRMRIDDTVAQSRRPGETRMPEGLCPSAGDVTAKWRAVPYEEQVERKRRKWLNALRLVTKNLRKELRGTGGIPWMEELFRREEGKGAPPCCALADVVTAEEGAGRMYYRNKNEFTVGRSPDACGKGHDYHRSVPSVGYALGLVREGQVFIGEVDEECYTTSEVARGVAHALTPIIRASKACPYDKRSHKGYWRQITCREGTRTGQVIVSVVVNPLTTEEEKTVAPAGHYSDAQCQTAVIDALRKHFGDEKRFGVFWQPSDHVSAVSSDIRAIHLYGIDALHEEMCGLRFRIQPTAFFQVNTIMAEKLYRLIGDLAQVGSETAIFDVCCGTGTIGLSLAKKAHSVVGIEMNEAAVEDAEYNAKLNGITNATFIAGKVENHIHDAIKKIAGNRECVVILDPPRAGLPMNVVAAVRAMKAVRRIVYVACEPNNFWRNALGFCRPRSKAFRLEPFRPVRAVGLDLFPHTDHGELAIVLERDSPPEGSS